VSDDEQPVSLLRGGPLPSGVDVRLIVIEPGAARPFDASEWKDGFVVVERGEIELSARRFVAGDVLTFDGLTLAELRNPGSEPALVAVATRQTRDRRA
jgi:hypothetical protein